MAKPDVSTVRVIATAGIMLDHGCECHDIREIAPDTEHDVYLTEKVLEHIDFGWLLPFYTLSDADRARMFVTDVPSRPRVHRSGG